MFFFIVKIMNLLFQFFQHQKPWLQQFLVFCNLTTIFVMLLTFCQLFCKIPIFIVWIVVQHQLDTWYDNGNGLFRVYCLYSEWKKCKNVFSSGVLCLHSVENHWICNSVNKLVCMLSISLTVLSVFCFIGFKSKSIFCNEKHSK